MAGHKPRHTQVSTEINEQRRKIMIIRKEGIENDKDFRQAYMNDNNGLITIDK